jgi:cobalamin biosynthesis Mg chelatase CobN
LELECDDRAVHPVTRARDGQQNSQEMHMDITTLLVILLVIVLLGGGWFGRGRWY